MKKLKQLFVIGLAMVAVFAFAACDSCSNDDDTDVDPSGTVATLSSISVDTSAAKTEYDYGETFSSDGIVVTATYSNNSTATIASGSYTVDSSAFNSSESGSYSIGVSYTESEVTKTTSYTVTVSASYGGLYITKTTTVYTVESSSGVTVTTDDLSVYLVDPSQTVSSAALSSSEYTLKYYKEGTELTGLENLTEGKYQIWAYAANPYSSSPDKLSNFIFIDVVDGVVSIALSNASTGTFTQVASGTDSMSSTWEYTLTYASGNTETIYGTDSNISIEGLSTLTEVTDAVATVTYTKVDATGKSTEVSCSVTYSITAAEAGSQTYTINFNSLSATPNDGDTLIDGVLYAIGQPGYSTNTRTHSDLTGETIKGRLQVNATDKGFKITVTGAATITVYAQSAGDAERGLALYDYSSGSKGSQIGDSASVGVSSADNELDKCVFTTSGAGTYCLFSTTSSVNVFYIIITF